MGRSNGASKPPVAAVMSEVKAKKLFDDPRVKAELQATIERLLGKEIVKVVQPNKKLDKPKDYYIDVKLDQLSQLFRDRKSGDKESSDWMAKLYENLQVEQYHVKVENGVLFKRLTEELADSDQRRKVQRPPEATGKVSAAEVVQLLDSLRSLKFNGDSKHPKPLKVQILQEKLDESLGKLKSLLSERPEGWTETYAKEVAVVKIVLSELEEFLKVMEGILLQEPVSSSKAKAMSVFALDAKKNLEHFRQSLKQWDNLANIIVDETPKNDDIIIVEHKKNGARVVTNSREEL